MICPKSYNDVTPRKTNWLWRPFIPFEKVTLLQGATGIGKTSLIMKILADISNGMYPPSMFRGQLLPSVQGEPLKSFYVTAENGIDDTIVPLFEQYGGNKDNALFQDEQEGHFLLTGAEIEECVRTTGAKVIFIDPWQQFVNGISTSDNAGLRNMVCDIQLAAERTGAAVILAGNFIKGLLPDINRGIGGTELYNTLRCILTLRADDGDDPSVRILEATKMSLIGKESTPVIIRQDEELGLSFESYDLLDEEDDEEEPIDFLVKTLKSGPQDSRKIMELASEHGFGTSQIYRLRKKAGIIIEKQPDRSSQWKLPT